MRDTFRRLYRRAQETLWIRPFIACVLSVAVALLALAADQRDFKALLPHVTTESVKALLSIMAASMLVIATFSLSTMISAYTAASRSATPRAFALVVADDVSQNALSAFIGSFIFSIVALVALLNGLYDAAGRFVLFVVTLIVFTLVIATFVRWVDRIARLGRMEATIEKAEDATVAAMIRQRDLPRFGASAPTEREADAEPVYTERIGYVQHLDLESMQAIVEKTQCVVELLATPGSFTTPRRAIAYVRRAHAAPADIAKEVEACFLIGKKRTFEDDPAFGLTVLSEIASRALSPGINDPGTAINVIGAFVRSFCTWLDPRAERRDEPSFDRVQAPDLSLDALYDDAFAALMRDGGGTVEVVVRLLEAFRSFLPLCDDQAASVTRHYAALAVQRAEAEMTSSRDLGKVHAAAELLTGSS